MNTWSSDYFDTLKGDFDNTELEESYLKSFQYFVETYRNGQFRQLRGMLEDIDESGEFSELLDYLEENSCTDVENWFYEVTGRERRKK